MRAAYIYLRNEMIAGVDQKPLAQAKALRRLGVDNIDVYVLSPARAEDRDGVRFVPFKLPRFLRYAAYIFCRYWLIGSHLPLSRYDCLILRYPGADLTALAFFRKYRIITEHHTKELDELLLSANTSRFPYNLTKRIHYTFEKHCGPRALRRARGLIAVTGEIAAYERARSGFKGETAIIPNGIDFESIPAASFRPFDGRELHLLMMPSRFEPWVGLDLLYGAIRRYTGEVKVVLHLVGKAPEIHPQVCRTEHYLPNSAAEMEKIFPRINLAVGNLGMHRKNLAEGCNLKTREYIARGLPFIIAHADPDLDAADSIRPFYFSAVGEPLSIQAVIEFLAALHAQYTPADITQRLREFAVKRLDWAVKMGAYRDFVEQVAGRG